MQSVAMWFASEVLHVRSYATCCNMISTLRTTAGSPWDKGHDHLITLRSNVFVVLQGMSAAPKSSSGHCCRSKRYSLE